MDNIRYMVIGNPVSHSLSPVMQNAAFEFFDGEKMYVLKELTLEELPDFVEFAKKNLRGFNVTVPFKKEIMKYCQVINEEAEEAESVNTVKIIGNKLYGYTTDGFGFLEAIRADLGINEIAGLNICLLGAGGAASAIGKTLQMEGAGKIVIINRTLEKATHLASRIGAEAVAADNLNAVTAAVNAAELVVNCTSLGLKKEDPLPLSGELIPQCKAIFDTIYWPTPLIITAKAAKVRVASGRAMLLFQGARSFEIWTGRAAPVIKMQLALYKEIEERAKLL